MAHVSVYNSLGKEIEKLNVSDAVFAVKIKESVVAEAALAQQSNRRVAIADTKMRGEVRGGGIKPWKQKGTGRARHGSIRSPLWKGGGVTFGPTSDRSFLKKINKKTRQAALRMVLSDKVKEQKLIVIDALPSTGKTKDMALVRKALPGAGKRMMIALDKRVDAVTRTLANMPRTDVQSARSLNVVDLLAHEYILIEKSTVSVIESLYA